MGQKKLPALAVFTIEADVASRLYLDSILIQLI